MRNKAKMNFVIPLFLAGALISLPAQANVAIHDDPNCDATILKIQNKVQKEVENAKARQNAGTVEADNFFKTVDACLDQIGGSLKNPFGIPKNPFDGFIDKACNYALDSLTANNPITKSVNAVSISDPTGTFSYNPDISLNRSGNFTGETIVKESDASGTLWKSVSKKLPSKSEIWGN